MTSNLKIGVVLVTFNRLSKLKKALQSYDNQDVSPSYVIVVDNASTDGTDSFLIEWKSSAQKYEKIVIKLEHNIGGSGGFYEGLRIALEKNADWIWVADDDAYPEKNCFNIALSYISSNQSSNISAVCGAVINNGKYCLNHRRRTYTKCFLYYSEPVPEKEYNSHFLINTYSFVGSILNKEKMSIAGLPKKDYFIWCDDSEHGLRMSKIGNIICLPEMTIIHDEDVNNKIISWKLYYGIRNQLDLIRSNFTKFVFWIMWIKFFLYALFFFFENKEKGLLYMTALKDVATNKFGLHSKYRPGWKIN